MESVVNYLEDTEKKLMKEMAELFSKMRQQRDTLSLQGIEDMYAYTPVEGVLYEPCVRIPGPGGHYYCSEYKLPKDEYVIFTRGSMRQHTSGQSYNGATHRCTVLTNYGRCFFTKHIGEYQCVYTSYAPTTDNNHIHCYINGYSSGITPIKKVDPLPYKMPEGFIKAFNMGISIAGIDGYLHMDAGGGINEGAIKIILDTTNSLQELNKEFYLFAGKWKPHMTECATLDIDTMRQTIIENGQCIEQLKANEESLEQQNKKLQAELKELKEQKATLEKEKTKLLPLEEYKKAVLEFMTTHVNCKKYKPIDSNIIDVFKQFHSDKVFMESWVYNDVINSKDELNEYRIYKKVKGEMVSSGMDNSSVARNVRSIKKSVNELNTTTARIGLDV
jgi:flagellar motility protein MotE (MotC chaperone)